MNLLVSMPGGAEWIMILFVLVVFPIALLLLIRWILRISYRDKQLLKQTQLLSEIAKHSGVPDSVVNMIING